VGKKTQMTIFASTNIFIAIIINNNNNKKKKKKKKNIKYVSKYDQHYCLLMIVEIIITVFILIRAQALVKFDYFSHLILNQKFRGC
jgi:hypothetical protein